jgi:GAF domain-containing protein
MSDVAAREILLAGGRVVAHVDGLQASLQILIDAIAESLGIASAAIVIADRSGTGLEIVATFGLDDAATAGLDEAIRLPTHPIARTFAEPASTFDVRPVNPGGPALRSHLPLFVTRGGTDNVLGVLALAHDHPIEPDTQPILEAAADLAAATIERHLPG